jgi:hypothetical protein
MIKLLLCATHVLRRYRASILYRARRNASIAATIGSQDTRHIAKRYVTLQCPPFQYIPKPNSSTTFLLNHVYFYKVKSAALRRFPDNVWQQKKMIKLNPFDDNVYCQFVVIGRWSAKEKHHVSVGECCLIHSPNCTVTGGKVKLQMLYRNPGFVATLVAHGGRATEKVMRAEAAKLGLGGDAASADVFWRANGRVRNLDNNLWEAKWSALPQYPTKLKEGNAAYTFWSRNGNNTFNKYFVAFYPVRCARRTPLSWAAFLFN